MVVCLSPNGRALYTDRRPPTRLLVGTVDGVTTLERRELGDTWQRAGHGLRGLHVSALLFEPRRGGLFAGVHGGGLYASVDGGRTWERKTRGLSPDHVWTLACVERDGAVVLYAGTEPAHLFCSTDYGESWEELPALRSVPGQERWMFPPPPHVPHVKNIAFDPTDSRIMYLGVEQGALLKSADAGQSWRELDSYYSPEDVFYKDVHRLVISPANPSRLYMATGDGLYASADGGETWEHVSRPTGRVGYPDALLLAPDDDQVLFMAGGAAAPPEWRRTDTANARVVRSRDGGRTWESLDQGLPAPLRANVEAMSMQVWPGGFSLFIGTTDGAVFASDDRGASWGPVARGLAPVSQSSHYRDLPRRDSGEPQARAAPVR